MNALPRRLLAPLTASTLVVTGLAGVAYAAPEPVTGVELNVEEPDFVAGVFTYDPARGTTEGLDALKELRGIMWDENPPFKVAEYTGSLRDAARSRGLDTKRKYQDAVRIDQDLNWVATQRAAEASAHFAHTRPDGTESGTAEKAERSINGESLAAGRESLRQAIVESWGKGELSNLKKADGAWTNGTGHLIHMLDPKHKVYGFGAVYARGAEFGNYYAAVTSPDFVEAGSTANARVTGYLHRAPLPGETPTGLKTGTPPLDSGTDSSLSSGSSGSSNNGGVDQILWIIIGAIPVILSLVGLAQQFLPF